MNPRERVRMALDHQAPDRVPLELGGAGITSASPQMQQRLRDVLGLREPPDPRFPYFDDAIQKYFEIDFRGIYLNDIARPGETTDEFGVMDYANAHDNPLAHVSREELKKFPWPVAEDPRRVEGLREYARFLHEETEYAVVGQHVGVGLFEGGLRLRGYERFLLDCASDPDWVRSFFDIILDLDSRLMDAYLGEVGEYLDVIWLGDDSCTQRGPYTSPKMYRQLVKPYFTEYIRRIRSKTNARIVHHCCGSCYRLLPDLIDIGVEVLNPVQPEAEDMDHARLKAEFGDRLSFWGGIGMQHLLPHGTPDEVRQGVRAAFETLGKGGGWVCAAVHTFTEDVPPENIIAMLEEGRECAYLPTGR
jgi:uroporphyrinogen decarboxylase